MVESLISPHVVPWLVDSWIVTGCSTTNMHLTAFCNVWACQPSCIQASENSVIAVEKPGEFEKAEKSREKLGRRMCTNPLNLQASMNFRGCRKKPGPKCGKNQAARPLAGAEVLVAVRGPLPGEGGGKNSNCY